MSSNYYPPGAFSFSVNFMGLGLLGVDASFQEVSGIQVQFDVEKVNEGGENRFSYNLPQRAKYSNLVLKRGLIALGSPLALWAGVTLGFPYAVPIVPAALLVTLLNENGNPLTAWAFVNAYPVRSEISTLNSMENRVLIETLELTYNYFQRIITPSL
jgi:phage tail-like protein